MVLEEAFRNYRQKIVDRWVKYTLSSYESSSFFKKEKDKFSNPVGGNTREALDRLFVLLAANADPQEFVSPLEQIMKIRSIQDFTPSQAVSPLHGVKHITRDVFEKDKETKDLIADLYDFEFAVDLMVLAAFDLYMQSRERLYQVRINEIRSGRHVLTDSTCPSKLLKKDRQGNKQLEVEESSKSL